MKRGLEMDAYIPDNLIFDKGALMVNFMCHAGRNTGYQDIWSHIILSAFVKVFWKKLTFKSVDFE